MAYHVKFVNNNDLPLHQQLVETLVPQKPTREERA